MNLLQRVAGLFERRSTPNDIFKLMLDGNATYAGPSVTEDNAMRSSAVYGCVRIIAESIASLPLVLYRKDGRNKERALDHPLYPILHDMANPELTAFEWRELMMAHVALRGNGWSEKELDNFGRTRALWPLSPAKMEGWDRRNGEIHWLYRTPDNQVRAIPNYRIHHIKGLGDGVMGISPIQQAARQAVGLSLAAEEYGSRFYSNGARPGLILRHPGKLSGAAATRLKESFATEHQGLSNAHRTKILEEGMDVTAVGIPNNEAQFLETRKFQVTEIARIYRVPPHMLADLDRATFSNIEQQSIGFVIHTLMPWFVRHEQAIYRDLLSPAERKTLSAKYVVAGLVRGDIATRYQAYTTAITTGFMTRNEARELEDLNPIEGLDEPLLPLNMMEAGSQPPASTPAPAQNREAEREVSVTGYTKVDEGEQRAQRATNDRRKLINRHTRLFEDAIGRIVKREISDIRKAANSKLGKRDASGFETWLENFYQDAREWMPDYLRALMLTYAETIMASVADELGENPGAVDDEWIDTYLANFVEVFAVGGEKQLRSLLEESEGDEDAAAKIHERLDGWEENRAEKTAFDQAFEAGNALATFGYLALGVKHVVWRGGDCPLCAKFNGKRIPIKGSFAKEGDTVEGDGVDPLPIVRTVKHGPLHNGCDCVTVAG